MNITKKRIFDYHCFRQKNLIYFIFLKKVLQETKHEFETFNNITF